MIAGKSAWRQVVCFCHAMLLAAQLWPQPYVDPLQLRYTYGFRNPKGEATPFTHWWAGSDIPVKLKANTYLLFSPYYEQWHLDSAGEENIFRTVHSLALPFGLMAPFHQSKWSLTIIATPRWNGEKLFDEKTFQFGAATFASYARRPGQKFRFGVYINGEFFGLFVMPLVGADWRMDEKNYLFGLLPGRLTYEHQWNKKLYGGVTFRAITNSFRLANTQYLRVDDNQGSLYLDFYPAKRFCITMEPGYGLYRKLRTGKDNRDYILKRKWGDGPFIRISSSYRIRL